MYKKYIFYYHLQTNQYEFLNIIKLNNKIIINIQYIVINNKS